MRLRRFTTKKVLLSLGAVGTAAAMAGLGTFATFTSSTSASQSVASGTVTIGLGATGAATNRLTVAASGIAAGDTMQRSVDLVDSGTVNLASITLTTTASPSSALDTDTTAGLQMVIDKCSTAWTEAGSSPAFTYTCGGTSSTVLASRAVIGSTMALSNLSMTAGSTDHLRVTLTLPSASTLQGATSTISYAFTATQRNATSA
ncbi:MAG: spore coat-associated protein [Actinomycetota bacterium]|jgi:predicted ribosomally synthesized peptide with SipW-like signal peptide